MTEEQRHNIFSRDQFLCTACGKHIVINGTPQLAHNIKSGKGSENHIIAYIWNTYRKDRSRKWVNKYILDNDMNLSSTCSLKCNDSKNIFFKPVERDALIDRIIEECELFSLNTPDK
jgi:5-methylcytosine-specific restriction endonuclease McrA